jgi:hypothetical protein
VFNLQEELESLAASLETQRIPYAVCGGLALAIHGHPRATRDLDLLVSREDLERAKGVARARGFDLVAAPMVFSAGVEVHRLSKVDGRHILTLDLLVVGESLEVAWTSRLRVPTMAGGLWVVSREGLIAMKVAASRPQDLVDVAKLRGDP